jgi:hypothetical protein
VDDVKVVAAGQDVIGTMRVGSTVRLMTFRTYADGRIGRDGENLPHVATPGLLTTLLGTDTISSVSAPVMVFGRPYVIGLFGGHLVSSDVVVTWRYSM